MTSNRVRIIVDTTACLPPDYIAAHRLENIPQVVLFGQESYLEDVELSYAEFCRRLRASSTLPKTAAPPPGLFVEAFQREFAAGAETLLCIHPSAEVSGTVRSALTAKEDAFPQADIRVVDTRTISANLASLVMCAVDWAESGVGADEIMRRIEEMIPRARTYFLVPTLEYLYKGGRIGGASALVGTALQIKPILEVKDGRVMPLEKVRTENRACERLKALVVEQCPRTPGAFVSVMHADDAGKAQALARDLQAALQTLQIPIYGLGASITTHAGPGTLGVSFFA